MEMGKKSGSSKQSKKEQYGEVIYRIKGRSIDIHKFPKLRIWNGSREHVEIYPERIDGTESIGTDSDNNPDVIDINLGSQYSASQPDDTVYEGDCLFPASKSDSASSSSSSSPSRSSDDLFRENVNGDIEPASDKHNEVHAISKNSLSEEENNSPRRASISRVSDSTYESSMSVMSPTQSPPMQVMDRSTGYDPSRIPPSAFARSISAIPQEWSIASNDSLFSIHIGNASFARDNAVIRDMHKSGELKKSCELPPKVPRPSTSASFKTDNNPKRPSIPIVDIEKPPKETEESGEIEVAAISAKNPVEPTPMDQNDGYKSDSIPSISFNKYTRFNAERDRASPLPVRKKKSCCSCFSCISCSYSSSFCSSPRQKSSWCFLKPRCCCSFRFSSCFSCCNWPCSCRSSCC